MAWDQLRSAFPLARLHVRRLRYLILALAGLLLSEPGAGSNGARLAARLLGWNAGLAEKSGDRLSAFAQLQNERLIQQARQKCSVSDWREAWASGQQWTVAEAISQCGDSLRG